jgi:hypothetical protein
VALPLWCNVEILRSISYLFSLIPLLMKSTA